jgi:hypothetical protein
MKHAKKNHDRILPIDGSENIDTYLQSFAEIIVDIKH